MAARKHLSPAQIAIRSFGGVKATARALGCEPTQVSKWSAPVDKRGCGGEIPRKAAKKILLLAKEQGLDITGEDLLLGREIQDEASA